MNTYKFEESLSKTLGVSPSHHPSISDQTLNEWSSSQDKIANLCGEANAFYGQKHSAESKAKMSAAAKKRPPRVGFRHTEESKRKVSLNNASKKAMRTHMGIFISKVEAAKAMNTTTNSLRVIMNQKIDDPVSRVSVIFGREHIGKTPRELGWAYV